MEYKLLNGNTMAKHPIVQSEVLFSLRQNNFISKQSLLFRKLAACFGFVVKPSSG